MDLLISTDIDYVIQKILIAASLTGTKLNVKKVNESELVKLEPKAKTVVLAANNGSITQHTAIIRYIGDISPLTPLNGLNGFENAQVDQWIDLCWNELEVPLQTLIALKSVDPLSPTHSLSATDKTELTKRCKVDIDEILSKLDEILASKTFFVGERVSLADVCVYATMDAILTQYKELSLMNSYSSVFRWYMTIGHISKVSTVLPISKSLASAVESLTGKKPPVGAPVAASSATASVISPAGTVGTGGSTSATTSQNLSMACKWDRHRLRVKELLADEARYVDQEVTVKGWIRTTREAEKGKLLFVELSDGSTVKGLQLIMDSVTTAGRKEVDSCGGVGASLSVVGKVVRSPKAGQSVEVHVTKVTVLGPVYGGDKGEIGAKNYPMSKKGHSLEFLREKAHLRPRSKVFSCAMRMRNAMAYATHKFFFERGFIYTHTPIITAADCEGAGEQFAVSALLGESVKVKDLPVDPKTGGLDYSKDYFGKRCCLTVSGQLNVETHACALSDVYTFGPTFRAEDSHTSRHLAEFWMIEPEICFADLSDDMALAEDYVRYCAHFALTECADDLIYFEEEYPDGEKGLRARLQNVADNEFARITYTEAVELLQSETKAGKVTFERFPNWGDDLGSEHERYLAEKIYQKPTIVSNYPKGIKAFYMKLNSDAKTVAAMDILVPKIGELIGGSQREDNLTVLETRCRESGLNPENIWWYNDLRRYGSVPHAGFGLGFERLIMFVTGMENIRDVIPFPRVPGHAEF